MIRDDSPKDECGIIGIFAPDEDVARMAFFGLYALQHRGQEAAGIAVSDGVTARLHKEAGLVSQVFNPHNLAPLQGHYAIGHTRYSTTGSSAARNAQPFLIETQHGPLGVAHNGNLVNANELRAELLRRGVGLSSSSDSEVITMMLAGADGDSWEERIRNTMPKWRGAYSLTVLTRDSVFAVRDPWGFRPLSVGRLPSGGHAAASESGALRTLGCDAIREVKPGEIVGLSNNALRVRQALPPEPQLARCTFEHIYFSRPDSFWDGLSVHHVRQRLGEELAREAPLDADVIVPVPDSSVPAAIGYSRISGIPYNDGFIKNRYIGRTFIEPTDSLRRQGVALKFNALEENLRGLRVVMIDDSIVRGNTSGPLVKLVRDAGAREVHVRITCPPIAHPCFMGVDMGTYHELIAHRMTIDEICDHIDADSLNFLSLNGMMRAIGRPEGYCNACFTGVYPIELDVEQTKTGFERAIA
ncbi:MAG TPA: amidophosphoribosyltransferase [Anaerolineales bacterium]|nr:amidophosphoribosyltransferase [Anaerolineales bacterium]HLF02710.1 amidophosphoribosyltransferase [Anaerolineales bacterium]